MNRNLRPDVRAHGTRTVGPRAAIVPAILAVLVIASLMDVTLWCDAHDVVAEPVPGLGTHAKTLGLTAGFPVEFNETGLPAGSTWNVTLNGTTQSASAGSNITFRELNGTYNYTLSGPAGYALISPTVTGVIHVAGTPNAVVVPGINVGSVPVSVTYDSTNGCIYVANYNSNNVTVIDGATDVVVANISVGSHPVAVAHDAANGYLYVLNTASDEVTVIDGTTNAVVGSIGVESHPSAVAYDTANGYLYVANGGSNTVTVIDGATNSVVIPSIGVGISPQAVAYDSANGCLYVANGGSNNVTVIDGAANMVVASVGTGKDPNLVAYDSLNGYIYVVNWNNKNITVIDGATDSVVPSDIGVGSNPHGIAYDSANGYIYVGSYASNNVEAINGATDTVAAPSIGVGTSPYGMTYDPSNGYLYVANFGSNNVTLIDGNGLLASDWGLAYPVTFVESDLPGGTEWRVEVTGQTPRTSTGGSIGIFLANGSYTFEVSAANKSYQAMGGSFKVNGAAISESIVFSPVTYSVTFMESGLLSETNWSVTLGGVTLSSATHTISFTRSNGTYAFTVGAVAGFTVFPVSGSLTVNGVPTSKAITFTRVTYSVTFTMKGLSSGTIWSVTLGGTTFYATANKIVFPEPNGSYPYIAAPVSGYTASPSAGWVTVAGSPMTIDLAFTRSSPSGFLGLSGDTGRYLLEGIVGMVVVGISVAFVLRLRHK